MHHIGKCDDGKGFLILKSLFCPSCDPLSNMCLVSEVDAHRGYSISLTDLKTHGSIYPSRVVSGLLNKMYWVQLFLAPFTSLKMSCLSPVMFLI